MLHSVQCTISLIIRSVPLAHSFHLFRITVSSSPTLDSLATVKTKITQSRKGYLVGTGSRGDILPITSDNVGAFRRRWHLRNHATSRNWKRRIPMHAICWFTSKGSTEVPYEMEWFVIAKPVPKIRRARERWRNQFNRVMHVHNKDLIELVRYNCCWVWWLYSHIIWLLVTCQKLKADW